MADAKSDLPQGTLDLLILKVVALGPLHGYAIAQRLQQVSRDVVQVQQGSLYPALHRLENRGLLGADWKVSDTGRDAKFYRLTTKGRPQLEASGELAAARRGGRPDPAAEGERVMTWWAGCCGRPPARDASSTRELRDHLERQVADYVAAG